MHDLGMTFTRTCSCNMPMCHDSSMQVVCFFIIFPSGGRWALFQTRQALLTDLGSPSKRFTKSLPKLFFFELIDSPCMLEGFASEWTRTCVVTFHRKSWEVLRRSSHIVDIDLEKNLCDCLFWVCFFDDRTRNILHIT